MSSSSKSNDLTSQECDLTFDLKRPDVLLANIDSLYCNYLYLKYFCCYVYSIDAYLCIYCLYSCWSRSSQSGVKPSHIHCVSKKSIGLYL